MEIAIVDDEINELKILSYKVKSYMEKRSLSCQIVTYTSGAELLKASRTFDLIFLDGQRHLCLRKTGKRNAVYPHIRKGKR